MKVTGSKGNGKLDLTAERENESWRYEKINIRFKDSEKNKKTIEIINLH
ncbi:cytochrome c oxidase assembly factor Coa1 family protein [Christiangramia portivictoriae]|nr:cytochrome c oxidase assembly factor Coa1 family protein [Christiangramia portivictoriae]